MQPSTLAVFFEFSRTAFSMSGAGLALFVVGLLAAKNDIGQARGIDKEDKQQHRELWPAYISTPPTAAASVN